MSRGAARYEVVAIRYGWAPSRKSELYYRYGAYGEPDAPQAMDFYFYVLRDGRRTVLVDTGFRPEAAEARTRRFCTTPPLEALARLGVKPDGVSELLVTHFHWDHIGNLEHFSGAELRIPAAEVEFWSDPVSRNPQFREHVDADDIASVLSAHRTGRARAVGADELVAPGIRAITVGGHAAGQQILIVDTDRGPVVLASDAAHLYEELALRRPFAIAVDIRQMYEAYDLLRSMEADGAIVVPGHDPAVTERFPTVGGEADGIAYQLA